VSWYYSEDRNMSLNKILHNFSIFLNSISFIVYNNMNKIVLALAIMTTTGAIFANTFELAHALNPQPLPPGLKHFPFFQAPPTPILPPGLKHFLFYPQQPT
jgi:hypothetical protein